MLRGLILGTVSGLALSAVALVAVSLLGPQPAGNAPPAPPLTTAPGVVAPEGAADTAADSAAVTAMLDAAATDPAASVTAPVTEGAVSAAPLVDTAPASMPDSAPEVALALPDTSAPPALAVGAEAPVMPNPLAEAPSQPTGEADLTISTAPATPTLPEIVVVEVLPEPVPEATAALATPADLTAQDVADLLSDPSLPAVSAQTREATVDPSTPADPDIAPPDPARVTSDTPPPAQVGDVPDDATDAPLPDTAGAPTEPAPEGSTAAEGAALADGAIPPIAEAEPADPVTLPDPGDAAAAERVLLAPEAAVDAPATLPAGLESVRINRPGAEPAPQDSALPATEPEVATGPALVQFATAFDNPLRLPLLSVILIDAGDLAGAPMAVAAIPFPITIAIDPARPGAAEAMAAYRAAGIEVAALVRLPVGAQPVDVAVVYEAAFATLPAAVAVLDIGEGGLRGDSAVLPQALDRLAADGRGLAILAEGLNSTVRRATEGGVPAVEVFRDLDSEDQDARVIRRFLDQAAFRARQDGDVVMLARVRPDTLSALLLWGAADRAAQVALAPLSAVMTAGQADAP